ncbi:MAG: GHKL domain-containing protein [Gemmiger sp.]|nr:GHKL domain-containing protein [Gemmiger sp.]
MPIAEVASLVVNTTVLVVAQMFLFVQLSELRYDRRKVAIFTCFVAAVLLMVCIGGNLIKGGWRDARWTLITLTIPSLIYFFVISRYRGIKFVITYCISDLSIALIDFFAFMAAWLLSGGNFWVDTLLRSGGLLLWCLALRFLIGDRYRKALALLDKGWGIMLLTTFSMYVLMELLAAYPTGIYERPQDMPIAMVMVAVMELMVIVLVQVIYNTLDAKERALREQALRGQLALAKRQHTLMAERYDEVRRMRHDMKYHMNILAGYASTKNYDKLLAYLADYQADLAALSEDMPVYTKNDTVNILVNYYDHCAKEAGIRTEWNLQLPEKLPLDDVYLTTLVGNILQNALEGCLRLPPSAERYLLGTFQVAKNSLLLHSKNSAQPVPLNEEGRLVSQKTGQPGLGLASIEYIVGQYNGYVSYRFEEDCFVIEAVLPLHHTAKEPQSC